MDHGLGSFFIVCLLLTITPGADTALVLNNALRLGQPAVIRTTLGICAGLLVHAVLSSLGLSIAIQKSAALFSTIKLIGAAYLAYLGAKGIWRAVRQGGGVKANVDVVPVAGTGSAFRQGALTNVLNPKVAVFYLTFLPQFVNPSHNVMIQSVGLAAIHIALSFVWLSAIGKFVSCSHAFLSQPRLKRRLEAVTGLALLGFGVRLALSRR